MPAIPQRRLFQWYVSAWPLISWLLFGVVGVYCVASIAGITGYPTAADGIVAGDAWNYWSGTPYTSEHYRYSPAFYWLTAPLRALSFDAFVVIGTIAHLAVIAWLGPWTILLAFDDVIRGNITTFLAAGLVLASGGQAWTWSWVLLTKVTPSIGLLYHVGRRDWRAVALALAATATIVAITWPFGLWPEWVESVAAAPDNYQTVDVLAPLPVRIVVGSALCLFASRWIWLLPVGMIIAMPGLWPSSFALLAALPRLLRAHQVEVPS
jgi:hypothetical protein